MKLVIIEDEPLVMENLVEIIESLDYDITISATLTSLEDAFAFFDQHDFPDLFLSDIQLSDGLSFDFFKKANPQVPVVFCTAYDEYALEAFKVNGIDYLLKPFNDSDITKTIEKYYQLFQKAKTPTANAPKIETLIKQLEVQSRNANQNILIHSGDMIKPIKALDINLVYLRNGLVHIKTNQGEQFISPFTMDKMTSILSPTAFRVNRQYIVQKDIISHASHHFGRKLQVHLTIPHKDAIIVSKAKATEFLKWLESAH